MISSSSQKARDYYDKIGSTYDDYSRQLWSRVYDTITWKITEPYVPTNAEALVFDGAGGTGKWSVPIARCGPKVVLGDISSGMLKVAKEKIAKEGLQERIEVKECDLRKLDFEDETFDMVFCDHALCFIKEQERAIKELARVLKKGHPLIVTAQNRYVLSLSLVSEDLDYSFKVLSEKGKYIMRNSLEVYALTPDEFKQLLENNGVEIKRIVGKLCTMPLGLSLEKLASEDYAQDFLKKILRIEFELMNNPDTVSLGGHMQAIGFKQHP